MNDAAPKRFYKDVAVVEEAGGFAIRLDDRSARTPARAPLRAPTRVCAQLVADEWAAQGRTIDFAPMRVMRLLATAIDRGAADRDAWIDIVLNFLKTDLLCYRADEPEALVVQQTAEWSPYLDWLGEMLGIRLLVASGVIAVEQPKESLDTARVALCEASAETVLAVKAMTEAAGSAVLALAVWRGPFTADAAFKASRLDERFQAERWGADAEATAREARLKADFDAAARFLAALRGESQ